MAWAEKSLSEAGIADVERSCLMAIKSEVESKTGDLSGVYLNVTLLVPHPSDNSKIKCVGRTDTHRRLNQNYKKDSMLAWESMRTGGVRYEAEFSEKGKPYHSIICFPLIYSVEDEDRALGSISIDHSAFHAFDDLTEDFEISLSPYLRMLELALVSREVFRQTETNTMIAAITDSSPMQ